MTHSNMCFNSWLCPGTPSLPLHTHPPPPPPPTHPFHFQTRVPHTDHTHISLFLQKVCFTSFPETPFFPQRSKVQTHSRCADHISQLDTLKRAHTLEFFPPALYCMSTHCNELLNKYILLHLIGTTIMFMAQIQIGADMCILYKLILLDPGCYFFQWAAKGPFKDFICARGAEEPECLKVVMMLCSWYLRDWLMCPMCHAFLFPSTFPPLRSLHGFPQHIWFSLPTPLARTFSSATLSPILSALSHLYFPTLSFSDPTRLSLCSAANPPPPSFLPLVLFSPRKSVSTFSPSSEASPPPDSSSKKSQLHK